MEYPDEEPNELRVAVAQGRGLKIMDKNLLSKGGSSDPMVTLALSCSTIKRKTHVKTKTLEPVWNEQFVWAASPPSSGPAPTLQLDVADYDQLSKADPMGSVTVDLGPFAAAKGQATKKWFALDGGDGAILLVIQWRHSPANDWRPFSAKDKFPGKPPNELRIGLSQGRELAVMDKNLLSKGGSSDPFVNFALEGTAVKFASVALVFSSPGFDAAAEARGVNATLAEDALVALADANDPVYFMARGNLTGATACTFATADDESCDTCFARDPHEGDEDPACVACFERHHIYGHYLRLLASEPLPDCAT